MLKVVNLHKGFGGIKAVDGCSFEAVDGKITALIGPNGAGKTTLFNLITGYMKQDSGRIMFKGQEISSLPAHKRALLGMSRTFQMIRLFPRMTVMENMLIAMREADDSVLNSLLFRKTEKILINRATELLEFVDLHVKANELACNLSYGQQKLLEIAKSLAADPEILMLDEPAAGINPTMLNKIKHLIRELNKKGKTILFIEHNMEFIMDIADKVVVLDYGKEIAYDVPDKIQKDKKVIDAYLGVV